MSWRWLSAESAREIHALQLDRFGGAAGTRDEGLFLSALARPENLAAYGDPDVAALAASYAYGLARNPPFIDGNKRTALVVAAVFLINNGFELIASEADAVLTFMALAAGDLTEDQLADWMRAHVDKCS
jgi:death on curing protein